MNPGFWFEYYTRKATELREAVQATNRSGKVFFSKMEIKENLPRNLQVFLENDRPLFLDVTLDNLVNRYGWLEKTEVDGIEMYRRQPASPHNTVGVLRLRKNLGKAEVLAALRMTTCWECK
jgi:hypothetical protein